MHAVHTHTRRRAPRPGELLSMTPMIDVVFQLLIYFVLTFELPDRVSQMQVWRPRGPGPDEPGAVLDRITVTPDGLAFNDTALTAPQLEKALNRLADLDATRSLIVVATDDSRHRQLVEVLNLVAKAGLENVSLLSAR